MSFTLYTEQNQNRKRRLESFDLGNCWQTFPWAITYSLYKFSRKKRKKTAFISGLEMENSLPYALEVALNCINSRKIFNSEDLHKLKKSFPRFRFTIRSDLIKCLSYIESQFFTHTYNYFWFLIWNHKTDILCSLNINILE